MGAGKNRTFSIIKNDAFDVFDLINTFFIAFRIFSLPIQERTLNADLLFLLEGL
jgi:hypothetical protein